MSRHEIEQAVEKLLEQDFDQVDWGGFDPGQKISGPWILCKKVTSEEDASALLLKMGFHDPVAQLGVSESSFIGTWWGMTWPAGDFTTRTTQPTGQIETITLGTIVNDRIYEVEVEATMAGTNTAWVEERTFEDAIT